MEAITALLRIAARFAGAAAALVARDGDETPVAAWGCDAAAARALLRIVRGEPASAERFVRRIPVTLRDGTTGEVILAVPSLNADARVLVMLAREIGASADATLVGEPSSAIERLTEGIEHLGEAVALLQVASSVEIAPTVLYINAGFTRLFGYQAEDLVGRSTDVLWGPRTEDQRMYWLRARMAAGESSRMAVEFVTRDGTPMWTELSAVPVEQPDGPVLQVVTYRDQSARKQFETALGAEKRKLQTTLAAIAEAVVTVLPDRRVDYLNDAAQTLLGIDFAEAYGRDVHDVLQVIDGDGRDVDLIATRGEPRRGEGFLRSRAGMIDVAYVASDIDDEAAGSVIVLRDITAEKGRALQLSFEASHDALTGLENRRAFLEQLEDALLGARAHDQHHVVGFLDLDHFKIVNDRFGHATGDRLLREIGTVMGRVVRGGDVLARIGGDEFALLLSNCRLDDARRVAEKIRRVVDVYRIEYRGESLGVGVSVGLAPLDAETPSAEQALAEADAACYQAKAAGRNVIVG